MGAHRRLHDGDELPPAGRLDFMARVMHTLGSAEPRFESSVVAVARVDGTLQLDALRERVRAELLQFWPLRCVIDGARAGRPRWRELGEAEITSLVGSRLVTAKQLASESQLDPYVGGLFGEPWDWTLPLWRIELVSFGGEARQSALLVRFNHCIADGVAMLKMCLCLFDGGRANAVDPPRRRRAGAAAAPSDAAPHAAASHFDAALVGLPGLAQRLAAPPLALARRLWICASGLAYGLLMPALPADSPGHLKLTSCLGQPGLSARRVAATGRALPFADVHEVKSAFGCTVSDVLVACVAGAVRAYERELEQENGLAAGSARAGGGGPYALPSARAGGGGPRRVRALFPANLRADGADPLLSIGNDWTLLSVRLPVELGTAAARLREAIRRCDELKASPELSVMVALNRAGIALLPPQAFARTSLRTMDKFTVLLSSLAGPPTQLSVLGRAVPSLAFFASSMVSTCFDLLTYDGNVQLSLLADPSVLPRGPTPLLRAFEDELDALVRAARAPPAPPPFDGLAWRRLGALLLLAAASAAGLRAVR